MRNTKRNINNKINSKSKKLGHVSVSGKHVYKQNNTKVRIPLFDCELCKKQKYVELLFWKW